MDVHIVAHVFRNDKTFFFIKYLKTLERIYRIPAGLRARLFLFPGPRFSLIFDLDSVILVLHAKAQWACVGHNPKKHGRWFGTALKTTD
jgi:hypothetical protein